MAGYFRAAADEEWLAAEVRMGRLVMTIDLQPQGESGGPRSRSIVLGEISNVDELAAGPEPWRTIELIGGESGPAQLMLSSPDVDRIIDTLVQLRASTEATAGRVGAAPMPQVASAAIPPAAVRMQAPGPQQMTAGAPTTDLSSRGEGAPKSRKPVSKVWLVIGLVLALAVAIYGWPALLTIAALYFVQKSFKKRPSTSQYRSLYLGLGAVVLIGGVAGQVLWIYRMRDSASTTPSQTPSAAAPSLTPPTTAAPPPTPAPTQPPDATFSVFVKSAFPASTSKSIAEVVVTNTSSVAGVPYCRVKLRDVTGVFKGSDLFEFTTVAAGATRSFNAEIIVENEGALYVTIGEADCT